MHESRVLVTTQTSPSRHSPSLVHYRSFSSMSTWSNIAAKTAGQKVTDSRHLQLKKEDASMTDDSVRTCQTEAEFYNELGCDLEFVKRFRRYLVERDAEIAEREKEEVRNPSPDKTLRSLKTVRPRFPWRFVQNDHNCWNEYFVENMLRKDMGMTHHCHLSYGCHYPDKCCEIEK